MNDFNATHTNLFPHMEFEKNGGFGNVGVGVLGYCCRVRGYRCSVLGIWSSVLGFWSSGLGLEYIIYSGLHVGYSCVCVCMYVCDWIGLIG